MDLRSDIRQSLYCVRALNLALTQVDEDTRLALESVRAEHIGTLCQELSRHWKRVASCSDAEALLFECADALRQYRPTISYDY